MNQRPQPVHDVVGRTIRASWGNCVLRGDWTTWLRRVGWRHYFRGGGCE